MERRIILLTVCLFPALLDAYSQSPGFRFQHLSVEDGLSQDIVTAIAQDSRGFMWYGTEDGLNCYDGYSLTVYKHQPEDSSSIADDRIGRLLADRRGRIWVETGAGCDVLDGTTRIVRHIQFPVSGIVSHAFCEAGDSSVWIGSDEGIFHEDHDRILSAVCVGARFPSALWSVTYEPPGFLWACGSTGLMYFRISNDTLYAITLPSSFRVLRGRGISTVFRDSDQNLWVCTSESGVFKFDSALLNVKHFAAGGIGPDVPMDKAVRLGVEDRSGMIWFGTMSGLDVFDPHQGMFRHVREGWPNSRGFIGSRVYSLFVDRAGIVWVGTYRGGVNSFAGVRQRFRSGVPPEPANGSDVYSLCNGPEGTLLVGTNAGLFSLDARGDRELWVPVEPLTRGPIYAICRRKNGEIWVGTEGEAVRIGNRARNTLRIRTPESDPVHLLYEDDEGQLWIGTDAQGLLMFDEHLDRAVPWTPGGGPMPGGVWTMFQDRRRHLWIGTWVNQFFYELDKSTNAVTRYGRGAGSAVVISTLAVRAIREDSAGALWLATWGSGVFRLDPLSHSIRQFTDADGLASNYAKSMEIDRRGRLWIGTERGLSLFDPPAGVFTTFTTREGLPSNFFYSGASLAIPGGYLSFGGAGGLVLFHPDSITHNTNPPPVVITTFRIFDKPVLPVAPGGGERHETLKYDQNFFSFEFVALDYTAPEKNRYAYMLEGFDRAWINAGSRRYAAYTHLDPGTYRFHVKASNNDGVWNEEGATTLITITPAYWMTWWFRTAVALLVIAAGVATYRFRLRKMLEVEGLRRRIARDLHDEIGTNLSAIVLASETGSRLHHSGPAQQDLEDIRTVALYTQEQMRDIVWLLNPRNDSTELLLARMKDDAARLLKGISYAFRSPETILPTQIDLGLKRNVFLIYKEALHNITRHSSATSVEIDIQTRDGSFLLTVRDNGRGFDVATTERGNGLVNMKARAEQIGAELEMESGPGQGTTVRLRAKIA